MTRFQSLCCILITGGFALASAGCPTPIVDAGPGTDAGTGADAGTLDAGQPPTDAGVSAEALCTSTNGTWDQTSCGHYSCGLPQECAAIIPGCDCGATSNFVEGVGCVEDTACTVVDGGGPTDESTCGATGGTWEALSCGDYVCGEAPSCKAIIPGCDCGLTSNFVDGVGCVEDGACAPVDGGGPTAEFMCGDTGGAWEAFSCGDYTCGQPPACAAVIPGCDCGATSNFVDGVGCIEDDACAPVDGGGPTAEFSCGDTGGTWEAFSCGNYTCGQAPACEAIIPGCDCGTTSNFVEGVGCVDDDACAPVDGGGPTAEFMCGDTGGAWQPFSCGDYTCGQPPACLALIPGCDCGTTSNFVNGSGCVVDDGCS